METTGPNEKVEALKAALKDLDKREREARSTYSQERQNINNAIALATARHFAVVHSVDANHGRHFDVFGVSEERDSRGHGLTFGVALSPSGEKAKNAVCVKVSGWDETTIQINLPPGGSTDFVINDGKEHIRHRYQVFIYEDLDTAQEKYAELKEQRS